MPAKDVFAHLPRGHLTVSSIHDLKRRWSVSAIALVHRLRSLNILTEWHYRTLCIALSEEGSRKSEKNGIQRETSQVFAKVFSALRAEGKSRGTIARALSITTEELDSLLVGLVMASVANSTARADDQPTSQDPPTREATKLRAV